MPIQNNKGISLLEVMVSMVILAIGILGLAPLMGIAIYNNTYSNDVTSVDALAQKELESMLQVLDYGTLPFMSTTDSVNGLYSVERRVDDANTDAMVPNGVYRVSVNVSWIDQVNKPRSVNYLVLKPKN